MKVLFYHYVRPTPEGMPHFRYLHLEDFRLQLDHLQATYGFVSRGDFLAAAEQEREVPGGVVLTFDDGFRDHHHHVLPELQHRDLWGIFYVPTGPYTSGKALSVHRVHHLLGRFGGATMMDRLNEHLRPAMLSDAGREAFRRETYKQDNDAATTEFKRTLNYYVAPRWQKPLLDALMTAFGDEAALVRSLYMSRNEIRVLQDAGMLVGSHSVSHPVFSKLPADDQEREIAESFAFLDEATGGLTHRTFCYPYGHSHTYNADTLRLLAEHGCRSAYTAEAADVTSGDMHRRPFELPRYDCNVFPHGHAAYGPRRPSA